MKKVWYAWCVLLLGSISVAWGNTDSPEKVVESFFYEMLEGDTHKAASMVYLPEEAMARDGVDEQEVRGKLSAGFQELRAEANAEGGFAALRFGKVRYKNADKTLATVELMTQGDDVVEIPVVKTASGWQISLDD